jgi:hypothetical protein
LAPKGPKGPKRQSVFEVHYSLFLKLDFWYVTKKKQFFASTKLHSFARMASHARISSTHSWNGAERRPQVVVFAAFGLPHMSHAAKPTMFQ